MKHLTVKIPTDTLRLYPVCDVQIGAPGVDTKGFAEYIQEAADDPVGRLVGVGDYTDGCSPSNRKEFDAAYVKGLMYDTQRDMLDAGSEAQVNAFNNLVAPTVGRWDVLLGGHHWLYKCKTDNGTVVWRPSDADIADYVNAPYVEAGSDVVITYSFPPLKKKGKRPYMRVWLRHLEGSGQTFAAPLNQLEKQMRAFNADIYLGGHHHKLVAAGAVKLSEDFKHPTQLKATEARLISAGSWMRSYMPDEVTYAEKAMLVPLATGAPIVTVRRRDDGSFKIRVEV